MSSCIIHPIRDSAKNKKYAKQKKNKKYKN